MFFKNEKCDILLMVKENFKRKI